MTKQQKLVLLSTLIRVYWQICLVARSYFTLSFEKPSICRTQREEPAATYVGLRISEGRFDHWFLSTYKCYNTEDRLYTTVFDGGRTVHVSDMLKVLSYDTVEQLFKTAERIQKLHLSLDEIILLKAVAVLSRGESLSSSNQRKHLGQGQPRQQGQPDKAFRHASTAPEFSKSSHHLTS